MNLWEREREREEEECEWVGKTLIREKRRGVISA